VKIFHYKKTLIFLGAIVVFFWLLSLETIPREEELKYGISFSRFHTDELKLDWEETYLALLNDLGVRDFRFSAHWPLTEPKEGKYNFSELDFQMREAKAKDATVILAVGRRLPGWPECHVPEWAKDLSWEEQQTRILKLIEIVINRYKTYDNILYWQVENEVFLTGFSRSNCGAFDRNFLQKEIDLVRSLDTRPVLATDSGELGTWYGAYKAGDVFGTSMYLYIWPRSLGFPIRYPIPPAFFRIKHNIITWLFGTKPSIVIELSTEPWLLQPIVDTPMDVLLRRMGLDKFNEMITFSSKTGFDTFYLWGAEWWYWMKLNGHPEFWERAQQIYK